MSKRRSRTNRPRRRKGSSGVSSRPSRAHVRVEVQYWFDPVEDLSGWHKTQARATRRNHLNQAVRTRMKKHGYSRRRAKLSVARSLQALANVTTDPKTKQVAKDDASDLFKEMK